jgi:agmatine deiminase
LLGDTRDRRAGDNLAKSAQSIFGVPRVATCIVAEGGALTTDGAGTLITTRSCLLHPKRNPVRDGEPREQMIERQLARFGIERVIWLEGDPCESITHGHVDGYVLFSAPGKVLVEIFNDEDLGPPMWREHDIALLEHVVDAGGKPLRVQCVRAPRERHRRFRGPLWAPCYLNAYVANGAVVTACFGDTERDEAAKKMLAGGFPDREIVTLQIDPIADGGGGIRCLTQPMPNDYTTLERRRPG